MSPEEKAQERVELRTIISAAAMVALIVRGSTRTGDIAIAAVNHAEALLDYLDRTKPKEKP